MNVAFSALRRVTQNIEGLQSTVLGQSVKCSRVPKFQPIAADKRFVQVLHTHWIAVTNSHSQPPNHVYMFDNLPCPYVFTDIVVQLTSLRRLLNEPDEIVINISNSARQPTRSKACGYYALAAVTQ
jgi:hypothetical protein